jgi:protein SCO1/2
MRIWLALLMVLVFSGGCSDKSPSVKEKFAATDITGVDYATDFHLSDHLGKIRTLSDFRGKVVALFFGYTHCPDVCPTTLSDMALALRQLGVDADKVQVLFVTVDPARDTPEIMAQYVPAFNPSFIGLVGTDQETARVTKNYHVFYQKSGNDPRNYTVDHSAGTYVFDTSGRLRLFMPYGQAPEAIAHDLALLLHGNPGA